MINNSLMVKTMKLIKEGQEFLQTQQISDAVLFLGQTGVGKSTLINYLAGVQLESFKQSLKTKLKAKDPSTELPQSKIGHYLSCTRYPTVYQPQGQTYCYIDTPGFEDTGNGGATEEDKAAQDIANAYFRSLIVTQTKRLKCVLLITENDLTSGRGSALAQRLKHLSDFIGAFGEDINTDLFKKIKESICIVVTKKPASETDQNTVKEILEEINTIINMLKGEDENDRENMLKDKEKNDRKNMLEVLKCIKEKQRIAIFSTPAGSSDKSFDEADLIKAMIDNTHFISTEEARITIQVSAAHQVKVQYAINDLIILTKEQLGLAINQDITQELKKYFESSPFNKEQLERLRISCETILKCNKPDKLQVFFDNLCENFRFLSVKTKNDFVEFIRFFNFFGGLLPGASGEERRSRDALLEKNWIQELDLAPAMNNQIQCITTLLDTPKFQLKDNELILTGFHIEINEVLINEVLINEVLKKLADENKYRNLKHIVFQAYHSLTIGQKAVSESKEVQEAFHGLKLHGVNVSLKAPQIFVLDNRLIDLSGVDGENYPPNLATATKGTDQSCNAADHGTDYSVNDNDYKGHKGGTGGDGAPGKPAQSSGNLYIICDQLHNPKKLHVKLKGGNGGNGQRGGDGGQGGAGANVYGNTRHKMPPKFLTNGGMGGDAGKGGKGGNAGHAGKLTLIVAGQELVLDPNQLSIKKGDAGKDGEAGTPGIGGAHGTQRREKNYDCKPASSGNGPSGNKAQGLNQIGWVEVKSIAEQNYFKNLLNYRLELAKLQNKYPAVMGDYLSKFSNYYSKINLVSLNTTLSDLLEAATTLEDNYLTYSKEYPTFNFLPLYSEFLEQIKAFSLARNRTQQELKILAYLYTVTLGCIARLNAKADNILIVNIDGYLKDLKDKFSKLRDLKVEELRQFYRKQYQDGIDVKIKEGKTFLDKLQIEVKSKLKNIEDAIKSLKAEIETEIANGQTENKKLQEMNKELNDKRRNQLIFGSMDLGLQAVGALYPPAKPGADIARAGLKMAQEPNLQNAKELGKRAKDYKADEKTQKEEHKKKKAADKGKGVIDKTESICATVSPVVKEAGNVVKDAKKVKEAMKEIDQQIEQNNARLEQLRNYIKEKLPEIRHYFEGTVEQITDFQTALQDKSLISLDFNKLERQRIFEEIRRNVDTVLGEFNAKAEFENIVDRMHDVMDVFVNICARIQEYREHSCFAEFIANSLSTSVEDPEIRKQYGEVLSHLKLLLQKSVVEEAYFRAVSAVKQWAFPFAERFLKVMEDVSGTDLKKTESEKKTELETLESKFNAMLERWTDNKNSITCIDKSKFSCNNFGINGNVIKPFVEWSYSQYSKKIRALLLKGEEVVFEADVRRHTAFDAVKFRRLGFKFECNKSKQEELDTLQSGYEVTLKHSGISCYQYLGKIYQIVNDYPLNISCQCGTNEPSNKNEVWSKIAKGDIVLSPYTTWTVKIGKLSTAVQQTPEEANLFEKFLDNDFKIKLIGTGSYVKPTEVNADLKLEEHYQLYREKPSSYLPPEVQAKNDGERSRTPNTKSSLGLKVGLQEGTVRFSVASKSAGASTSSNKAFPKKLDENEDQEYEYVSKPKSSRA